jgi:hypothetical protein
LAFAVGAALVVAAAHLQYWETHADLLDAAQADRLARIAAQVEEEVAAYPLRARGAFTDWLVDARGYGRQFVEFEAADEPPGTPEEYRTFIADLLRNGFPISAAQLESIAFQSRKAAGGAMTVVLAMEWILLGVLVFCFQ